MQNQVPKLTVNTILDAAKSILPSENIDRSHVATLVLGQYRRRQNQILRLELLR